MSEWFHSRILPLVDQSVEAQRRSVVGWWRALSYRECFLVNKLLTGSLRVGVSRSLVTRALADSLAQPRVQIEMPGRTIEIDGLAFDHFHRDVGHAVFGPARVVKLRDVRVIAPKW